MLLHVLLQKNVERREPLRHRHRITTVGIEVQSLAHALGHLGPSDAARQRRPVADALGHRDDIRTNTVVLKPPELRTCPAKARLHFIADAHTAVRPDHLVHPRQIVARQLDRSAHTLDRLGNESGDLACACVAKYVFDFGGILRPGIWIVIAMWTAIPIRTLDVLDAEPVRIRILPGMQRRQPHRLIAEAVIGVAKRQDVEIARVQPGHEHREIVGLAAGVGEITDAETRVLRKRRDEFLSELGNIGVQVDRRGVLQAFILLTNSFDDLRMAVAHRHRDDSRDAIEVSPSRLIKEPLHVAFDDHDRLGVVRHKGGREKLASHVENGFTARTVIRTRLMRAGRQLGMVSHFALSPVTGNCLKSQYRAIASGRPMNHA